MTEKPSLNMWPTKAWPLCSITFVPAGRPPWSLWPTKRRFLRATAGSFTDPSLATEMRGPAHCLSRASIFHPASAGRRRDFVQHLLPRFRTELRDGARRDDQHNGETDEHGREPVAVLDPQNGGNDESGRHTSHPS